MSSALDDAPPDETQPVDCHARDVASIVGKNLKRLRKARGYSLERLAELSGVSRAMLGQIETYKSVPTISLLWKIADGLGVPVAHLVAIEDRASALLLRRDQTAVYTSREGRVTKRALFDPRHPGQAQIFELSLEPGASETLDPHPDGGRVSLIVLEGALVVTVGKDHPVKVTAGDTIIFDCDTPHLLTNETSAAAIALSVLYAGPNLP